MKKINVKAVAAYKGHSIKENGNISLSLKLKYDELVNTIQMMQMLNNDVSLVVKIADESPLKIGSFRINNFKIDGDGESTVTLASMVDYIEMDNINSIITKDLFNIRMVAVIEEEEEDE